MKHLDLEQSKNNEALSKEDSQKQLLSDEQWKELEEKAQPTFWGHLGCKLTSLTIEEAVTSLDVGPHHMNMLHIVHGGVTSTLLDNTMGIMAMAVRPEFNMVTSNLNVHFVSPLKGPTITTHAKVLHSSTRTLTCYAEVRNEDGTVGAMATATFRAMRK